jgi:hypothetical protein
LKQRIAEREGLVKKRFEKLHSTLSTDFKNGKYLSIDECKNK